MKDNINTLQSSDPSETDKTKFRTCFIIGCVIGFFAVAFYIYASVIAIKAIWVCTTYPGDAVERFGAALSMAMAIGIALYGAIPIAVTIVLISIGIMWNKKAGISVLSIVLAAVLALVGCIVAWVRLPPAESSYKEREVGDFVVWFYKDYCEIYGTSEQGNNKRFLVIPEYLDGVRVDAFGFRSILGAIDFTSEDELTCPRIESTTIEKIYFEKGISCYPSLWNGYISSNIKKIMYPTADDYGQRIDGRDIYYPRYIYEKAIEDGKISRYDSKYPANVSYYYNYENTKNNGYYWIDDCDYGGKIEFIPPEPKREGYTFDGWYKEPECINKWDFEVDTLPEEKKEAVSTDGETMTEEVTVYQETILYAKWI